MILKIVVELISKNEIGVTFQLSEKEYCSKILQHEKSILKLINTTAQCSLLQDGFSLQNLAFFVDTIENTMGQVFFTQSRVYIKSKLISNDEIRREINEQNEFLKF